MKGRRDNQGCGTYIAAVTIGILMATMLPVWVCFWIVCGLLAWICFL